MPEATQPPHFEGMPLDLRFWNDIDAIASDGDVPCGTSIGSERQPQHGREAGTHRIDNHATQIPLADFSRFRRVLGRFQEGHDPNGLVEG